MKQIPRWEITPEHLFLNRRKFMIGAGSAVGALAVAACGMPQTTAPAAVQPEAEAAEALPTADLPPALAHAEPYAGAETDELGDSLNEFDDIANYNNYYEFDTDKQAVAGLARDFSTSPWSVEVAGMVNKPRTFTPAELIEIFPQEERIYRLRCVEAWSMVIPWVGFPVANLLNEVEPTSDAKFVSFTSVFRPDEMPGQRSPWLKWPYLEGLRLDEAMNDLAILATGMYGKPLTNQNGAPLRLVAPWKYGFKSGKAIVKIELTDTMPTTTWMAAAPHEYGFFANVNPNVDHPRWSQATERRIGELGRRNTLMFNGYEDEVADLYAGMDLAENY